MLAPKNNLLYVTILIPKIWNLSLGIWKFFVFLFRGLPILALKNNLIHVAIITQNLVVNPVFLFCVFFFRGWKILALKNYLLHVTIITYKIC
jgi:hypothetical protein